jgi:hypothetical protein
MAFRNASNDGGEVTSWVNNVVSAMSVLGPLSPLIATKSRTSWDFSFGRITEVFPVRIDLSDSAFHGIRAAISFGDAAYGDH